MLSSRGTSMFDRDLGFIKQFTPVEGGYVYYPSHKTAGKLVTVEEFERLRADWQRVAGWSGRWKLVGLVVVTLIFWTLLLNGLQLPEWLEKAVMAGIVAAMAGRLLWASFAPLRLVKGKPAVTLPRPAAEAWREARAVMSWPSVLIAILVFGILFIFWATAWERSLKAWAWTIASGTMLAAYLWIAVQKLRDRRS
jgi:hypothetical protein